MRSAKATVFSALVLCTIAACFTSQTAPPSNGELDASLPGDDAAVLSDDSQALVEASIEAAPHGTDATVMTEAGMDAPAVLVEASADAPSPEAGPEAGQEAGPDASVDAAPDAPMACGNGVREGSEECDGADLGGATCQSLHGASALGTLACGALCTFTASSCTWCGDNIINDGEICDGTAPTSLTCGQVLNATASGTLACAADCQSWDLSGCVCGGGYTVCTNGTPTCADLNNNANNCGACGNSCGTTGACSFGHCVTVLAKGVSSSLGVAVDATSLYYTSPADGKVYSMPLAGGTPVSLTTSGQSPSAYDITLVGGTLFWSTYNSGGILKVPVTGGAALPVFSGGQVIQGIANDGTSVYWADEYASKIQTANIASGVVQTLEPQPDAGVPDGGAIVTSPTPVVVDANHIYWGNVGATASVYQANKDGSNPMALITGVNPSNGSWLAVDSTNVYYTVFNTGAVLSVPIGGGTVTTLSTGESQPGPIVSDSTALYWKVTGAIRKYPKAGGPATTLANCANLSTVSAGQCSSPNRLTVDATYVYWTDVGGALFRVVKN